MGKRLSISQPTIIQTQLAPLTETFWLTTNSDSKEQWYYENTNLFSPNREISPLIITPHLSALDIDTNIVYEPNYSTMTWKVRYWNGTAWVTETISETQDDPSHPYVKSGYNLIVHKNNPDPTHGITITCEAVYYDPRDAGMTYKVIDSLELTTNKDATVLYPNIDVLTEPSIMYNPLRTGSSVFELKATADWSQVSDINENILQYKADSLGTEAIVPSNDENVETCSPKMDIRYGDHPVREDEQFMFRQVADGDYAGEPIDKAYIERMKGNTVVLNQLFNGDNHTNIVAGINITITDGHVVGSGTPSTTSGTPILINGTSLVIGHKYYVHYSGSHTGCALRFYAGASYQELDLTESLIVTADGTSDANFVFFGKSVSDSVSIDCYLYFIDLTEIYGEGNEPTTVAAFEAWLATNVGLKGYYTYNEGSLIPVKTSAIKTVGFNQWDEEWESGAINNDGSDGQGTSYIRSSNMIHVTPSTSYFFKSTKNMYAFEYDASKNPIGWIRSDNNDEVKNTSQTTKANTHYLRFFSESTTYNHDICINISDASKNGTYEAYREDKTSLPITTLKGKLNGSGSSVTIFPDGMKSAGSVYDEIKVENGQLKAIKRVGSVDLGSLTWNMYATSAFATTELDNPIGVVGSTMKGMCVNYETYPTVYDNAAATGTDKVIRGYSGAHGVVVKDTSFSSSTTFKSAMQGVMLYYELAEPQEYVLDPLPRGVFEWYAFINGQETLIENHPAYQETLQDVGKGQHTDAIKVDALYDEDMHIMLRIKNFASDSEPLPPKVFRNIVWRIPNIDCIVQCNNGSAARDSSNKFVFSTIVNIKGENLSEETIEENLRFLWKWRRVNMAQASAPVNTFGWGRSIEMTKAQMINTTQGGSIATTSVLNEAYLLGAKEEVTINGEVVTYNGQKLYTRPLDE